MNKGELLRRIYQVKDELNIQTKELDDILSTPIWSEILSKEIDKTVEVTRELKDIIDKLSSILGKINTKK